MEQQAEGYGVLTLPEILSSFFKIKSTHWSIVMEELKSIDGLMVDDKLLENLEKSNSEEYADFKEWLIDDLINPWKRNFEIDFERSHIQIDMTGHGVYYLFIPCDMGGHAMLEVFNKLNPNKDK